MRPYPLPECPLAGADIRRQSTEIGREIEPSAPCFTGQGCPAGIPGKVIIPCPRNIHTRGSTQIFPEVETGIELEDGVLPGRCIEFAVDFDDPDKTDVAAEVQAELHEVGTMHGLDERAPPEVDRVGSDLPSDEARHRFAADVEVPMKAEEHLIPAFDELLDDHTLVNVREHPDIRLQFTCTGQSS